MSVPNYYTVNKESKHIEEGYQIWISVYSKIKILDEKVNENKDEYIDESVVMI